MLEVSPGRCQIVEQAVDNEQRAKATLELDRAQLQQQRQQINVLDSQAKQARATLGAQKAARDLAKINLGYTRIVAPVDGMVGQRLVQPGQYLSVGTQVIWVAPLPNIWVIANYKETQMTNIRVGQKAQVTVDAFPGAVLHGRVDSWSPASGAQFALLPPDNATGNFTKVVQRIPVKITLEPDPALGDLLRPGMSVIATIDTRSAPPGRRRRLRRTGRRERIADQRRGNAPGASPRAPSAIPSVPPPIARRSIARSSPRAPLIGVLAVLLGSVISTLDSRITTFGLADVRGAVHAGFDEGAWITTAFTVGQMLMGPVSVWLGMVFGPRRVLMISSAVFAVSNLLLPFSPDLRFVLAFQMVSGLASGTFIPLTIGFVAQNLPPRLVVYGVAAYVLNLELSLNIAASIEGWFSDYWSWKWIFWDTALLAPLMLVCVHFGMPRQPINRALLKTADWSGIVYAGVGFSLLYAALDQGNRLDWLNSGLICALLLGGALLLVAFVVQELTHHRPWVDLRFAARGNFPLLFLFIAFFRFTILSTSYIIPQYLTTVQGYRAMEVGGVLVWIALPQFVLAPVTATMLRFIDARLLTALGFALIGVACFMAGQLTDQWIRRRLLALADRTGVRPVHRADVIGLARTCSTWTRARFSPSARCCRPGACSARKSARPSSKPS